MTPRQVRAAVTMAVLAVVIVAGGAWAFSALFSPLPDSGFGASEPEDVCAVRDVAAGTRLTPDGVTVNVLNAGDRSGAAGQTMRRLVRAGFAEGTQDNAPDDAEVGVVQIWAEDPDDPAVRLVSTWLGGNVRVVDRDTDLDGVYVVVGDRFDELREGRQGLRVREDTTVCGPPTA